MLFKRNDILFVLALAMIISLFISRAALSIAMSIFILIAVCTASPVNTIKNFIQSKILCAMSLLFVVPLLSGLWTEDQSSWLDSLRTKLPLLILPLAFATGFAFSFTQWKTIVIIAGALVFTGSIWTISNYVGAPDQFEQGYLRSNTLPTPLDNDHVRFSWLSGFSIFLFGWLFTIEKKKFFRTVWCLLIIWMIVFVHILAARTGLLVFYVFSFAFMIRLLFRKRSVGVMASVMGIMIALPVLAYLVVPTFRNRMKFIGYDYGYFKDAHYLPGGNDAIRIISYRVGLGIIRNEPVCGQGFGDIDESVSNWYEKHHSEIKMEDRIRPSSELLIYGMGAGLIGILTFIFSICFPFFIKVKNRFVWCVLLFIITFPLLYDVGLEIQYGVFLYAMPVLFLWKWFTGVDEKK